MRRLVLFAGAVATLLAVLSLGGLIGGTEIASRQVAAQAILAAGNAVRHVAQSDLLTYRGSVSLIVALLGGATLFGAIRNRNRPIAVLASEMRVEFRDATGADVVVSRTQFLRANQPGVSAYYMQASTEFGGSIPRAAITVTAFAGSRKVPSHADIPPTSGESRLEIAHVFEQAMPFGIANILIPEAIARFLVTRTRLRPGSIVRREISIRYANEHTLNNSYYQVTADRYIQRNVRISVTFHEGREPVLDHGVLPAQLIRRNGIEPVYATIRSARAHEFVFRKLRNERLRIPFTFK